MTRRSLGSEQPAIEVENKSKGSERNAHAILLYTQTHKHRLKRINCIGWILLINSILGILGLHYVERSK